MASRCDDRCVAPEKKAMSSADEGAHLGKAAAKSGTGTVSFTRLNYSDIQLEMVSSFLMIGFPL